MIERNPFASIDVDGVGELVRIGAERGRAARPGLKLGICGEHGGDPASVAFFHARRPRLRLVLALPRADRAPRRRPRRARRHGRRQVSEPAIDAALTPGEALEPCDVAIVVDTIRATTTALYALRQGYARGDLLRRGRRRPRRGRGDRRRGDPRGRARVRAHRGLPPRQLAARVRRRPAARRRARADDDERHARRAAGPGRGPASCSSARSPTSRRPPRTPRA